MVMLMLAMVILVHFWVVYWPTGPPARTPTPRSRSNLQPAACSQHQLWQCSLATCHLAHARPGSSLVWTVHGAFNVPYPRTNSHMAMAMAMRIVTRVFVFAIVLLGGVRFK